MRNRKSLIAVSLLLAALNFLLVARSPRFEALHAVEILELVAGGMCVGIALMAMLGRLKPRD